MKERRVTSNGGNYGKHGNNGYEWHMDRRYDEAMASR